MEKKEKLQIFYITSGVLFFMFPEMFFLGLEKSFNMLCFVWSLYFLLVYRHQIVPYTIKIMHLAMVGDTTTTKELYTESWQEKIQKFWKGSEKPTRENLIKFCQFSRSESEKIINFLKDKKALVRGGEKNQYKKEILDLSPLFEEMEIIRA